MMNHIHNPVSRHPNCDHGNLQNRRHLMNSQMVKRILAALFRKLRSAKVNKFAQVFFMLDKVQRHKLIKTWNIYMNHFVPTVKSGEQRSVIV